MSKKNLTLFGEAESEDSALELIQAIHVNMHDFEPRQVRIVQELLQQSYQSGYQKAKNEREQFVIIPLDILEHKKLAPNAKLLYGEISALGRGPQGCIASNKHFSEVLGLKERNIQYLLGELKKQKLIDIQIIKSRKGTYRSIFTIYQLTHMTGDAKKTTPGTQKNAPQKRNTEKEIKEKYIKRNLSTPRGGTQSLKEIFEERRSK